MNLMQFEEMQRDIVIGVVRVRHLAQLIDELRLMQDKICAARCDNIGNGIGRYSIKCNASELAEKLESFEDQLEEITACVESELCEAKKDADKAYRAMQCAIFCSDAE